ncbi:MAG: efflux RND transporter periplasmic adaptor subunit [Alteromonadaceae bacterium]|nr:efflux RND transporter periplasmic adaptor subunit [Alteromonadaceae bacterium]
MRNFFFKNKALPLFIVMLGVGLAYFILNTGDQKPAHFKKNQSKRLRIVQTSKLVKGSIVPFWNASGSVKPAESVKIHARVSGNISLINSLAMPGGWLKKGQWLAKLETVDLELALKSQQAQLEQAKANIALVQADQILAKEELLLLNNIDGFSIDESLVLREPQLTVAKAKVSVAKNNVEKAELNLSRTSVLMPFDGKIISKDIGTGSKVSTNTSLFSVVNTDVYWLEVKIPHKFLALFDKQQLADVSQTRLWGEGKYRKAKFVSILPELDNKDRQVKVLLAIDDPQTEKSNQPQVFLNDFLNVQLKGKPIKNAWTIKHSWLQSDNTIWVVDKKSTLQKRAIDVLFKGRDVIYVRTEIKPGDRALAEKPGIASVGLSVRPRKSLSSSIGKIKGENKPNNKAINEERKEKQKANKEKKQKGLNYAR